MPNTTLQRPLVARNSLAPGRAIVPPTSGLLHGNKIVPE
jgi:hypothetical protein